MWNQNSNINNNRDYNRRWLIAGYSYQLYVCVLRLVDLLSKKIDTVYIEKASSEQDIFDDVKIYVGNQIHHYQVKSGTTQTQFNQDEFVEPDGKLYIRKLFLAWRDIDKKTQRI